MVHHARGKSDVQQRLRDFVRETQMYKPWLRYDITQLGSFDAGNFGRLTIWQLRCRTRRARTPDTSTWWDDYLLTVIAQRDVLVTIILGAPDIKDIVPKIDSLKELARSVRIIDASQALPDIVAISPHLSDETIKDQLLRLTPLGTPMKQVYDVLQLRLESIGFGQVGKGPCWVNGDLHAQFGSYLVAHPSATAAEVFWRSDKQHKLRDIEVRRRVIENTKPTRPCQNAHSAER